MLGKLGSQQWIVPRIGKNAISRLFFLSVTSPMFASFLDVLQQEPLFSVHLENHSSFLTGTVHVGAVPMDTTVPLVSQQRRKAPAAPTYSKNPKKSRMELSPNKLFSLIHVCLFSRVSRGQGYPQPTTEGNKSGNSADKARCAPP